MIILEPKFSLGKTFATAAVTAWAEQEKIDLSRYLHQHNCGQWGDLDAEDKVANEDAHKHGSRIFSSYKIGKRKVFCITKADRSLATLLFANEY